MWLTLGLFFFPLSSQIAATKAELHIRSATPGGDHMKQEDTCWSVSVWGTVKESGPANLWVSHSD